MQQREKLKLKAPERNDGEASLLSSPLVSSHLIALHCIALQSISSRLVSSRLLAISASSGVPTQTPSPDVNEGLRAGL